MNIHNVVNNIDWTAPSMDLFVIVVFIAGIFLYNLTLDRYKVLVILISSYLSLALVNKSSLIFGMIGINIKSSFMTDSIIFLGWILILFFVFLNSVFSSVFDKNKGSWLQTSIIGFLQIGFLVSVIVSFLPPEEVNSSSSFIKSVFIADQAQFFWLLSPFMVMMLFKTKD